MKKTFLAIVACIALVVGVDAQQIDLTKQVKGVLPTTNGGFPLSSSGHVGTGGSISPTGSGQNAANQIWAVIAAPFPAVNAWTLTGGGLLAGHTYFSRFTFNTAAGETLPGGVAAVSPASPCTSGSTCTVTLNAPTIPSGYTGYTVYFQDQVNGSMLKYLSCVNITTNCTITADATGAAPPTVATAYAVPSPQGANLCSPSTQPFLFVSDGTNYYPYMGVDNATSASQVAPFNKLTICRPVWVNDTGFAPPGFQYGFFNVFHTQNGTDEPTTLNPDTGLTVFTSNCFPTNGSCTDSGSHYGLVAEQVEQDVNGTPTITGAPDGEITALSIQEADFHTGNLAIPTFGENGLRVTTYRETSTGAFSGSYMNGVYSWFQNDSNTSAGSSQANAFNGKCLDANANANALNCAIFFAQSVSPTFSQGYDFYGDDTGSGSLFMNIRSAAGNENQGKNYFQGATYLQHIDAANLNASFGFTNPTCSFATGGGTSPSCAIRAGSTDSLGRIVLTTGSGSPAGTITATVTFHTAFVAPVTDVSCVFTPQNNGGTWNGLAVPVITAHSLSAITVQITNGTAPTPLSTSTTYDINYQCWGN